MRKLLLAAAILPLALPAHGAPATWTILRQVCWKISDTAGQCAVGLYGSFATREACLGRVRDLLVTHPDTRGRAVLDLPYVTTAHRLVPA